jgi:hypothetical protein
MTWQATLQTVSNIACNFPFEVPNGRSGQFSFKDMMSSVMA